MICVKCSAEATLVVDSRERSDGRVIRRRRKCVVCGHRFTTWEGASRADLHEAEADASEAMAGTPLRREIMAAAETMGRSDIVLLAYIVRRMRGENLDPTIMGSHLAKVSGEFGGVISETRHPALTGP